ncbi:ribonuclease H-like domain-containing protein [Tanacetum coccineum]|uniref:Ribonuclease H-like domain-containing protein n=1 Tax=Tanacetum coccineum TaxID=301880 RepID=A0ABQ4ZIS2_9ASTR
MALCPLSNNNTSSSNKVVNAAHEVSTASTEVNAANSTNIDNLSDVEGSLLLMAMRPLVLTSTKWSATAAIKEDILSDQAEEEPNYALMAHSSPSSDSEDIQVGEITIRELRKKLEIVQKQKDGIQLNVDKFENASKSLNKLIECHIVDNCKKGLGYEKYNAVPPPYTGNFMPPTPDLSFTGLDEFANKLVVENCKDISSKEEPKEVRKNDDVSIIEEWVGKEVNTARSKAVVNDVKGYNVNAIKASAYYKEIDGGYVAFGGNRKGGNYENLVDHKVKVIRCDNGTEFKNREMNQFCEMKGILRQFSVARTPQQNGVAERRNRTLIEAARTMLADSKLPTTFWAEAVNTACYVQNRVLVVKPHNKTPYEIFHGRTPTLSFMRPFRCPITILNIIDHLRKFDGKADEGFFVGYSLNSKAFRVFNSRTRIVEENLHIRFSKSTPNVVQKQVIMQVKLERRQNLSKITFLLPLWTADPPYSQDQKSSHDDRSKPSSDDGKKVDEDPRKDSECNDQEKEDNVNITNTVNVASINEVNVVDRKTSIELPVDPNMPALEDDSIFDFTRDDEDDGVEADMNNLATTIQVSPIPTTRIHKDHPLLINEGSKLDRGYAGRASTIQVTRSLDFNWLLKDTYKKKGLTMMKSLHTVARIEIEEEVYVCKPPRFEDLDFPDRVYKVEKALYILHQAPRAWYKTLSTYLLDNGFQRGKIDKTLLIKRHKEVKTVSTPMETQKPLLKDENDNEVDVYMYRSMIGSLMYLTSSRPDIMFVVCAYARYQVNPKVSHLHVVKRIFSMVKNLDNVSGNFLMYPRFVQVFLNQQLDEVPSHKRIYDAPSHTKKIFGNMKRVGKGFFGRVTPLFPTMVVQNQTELGEGSAIPTDPYHTPTIIESSTQPQKTQKPRKPKRKDTQVPQPSGPTDIVADKAVHKELGDSLVRAATTASSLEAEQDSGNITKTRSKATPNEVGSQGTTSGGGPRRQETMGDTIAQTGFKNVSKHSNDLLLVREKTKTTQAEEIVSLKRRVKKLEQKKRSKTHKLKRLRKVGATARVESSNDESLGEDASKQGRIYDIDADDDITLVNVQDDAKMFNVNTLTGDEVFAEQEVVAKDVNLTVDEVTLAQTLAALKSVKPKLAERLQAEEQEQFTIEQKATLFKELLEKRRKHFVAKRAEEKRNTPPTKTQQKKTMITYLKNMEGWKHKDLKYKNFNSIKELFDKALKRVNMFVDFRTELETAEVDNNQEADKIKKLMEIVSNEEEVTIDAIPLAVKPPSIMYMVFSQMLKSFNRQDLEDLYKLVKVKYELTRPVEDMDLVLWNDLKVMFEPHEEDVIWMNQQAYKVLEWKLYDSCGVHFLRMQHMQIYMLVEKKYPLAPSKLSQMLEKKLQIDYESEMAYQLCKLIIKQLKNP